jgi:hypothetical protein
MSRDRRLANFYLSYHRYFHTPGKHYFKIVVITGGFNINYFDIQESFGTEIKTDRIDNVSIYPNPASE